MSPSTEKEKILFAKYSLSRINAKINDITLSYKRLLAEKEENLNIIKRAICSDDPTYVHSLYLKIEQFLEDTIKNNSFNHFVTSFLLGLFLENPFVSLANLDGKNKFNGRVLFNAMQQL